MKAVKLHYVIPYDMKDSKKVVNICIYIVREIEHKSVSHFVPFLSFPFFFSYLLSFLFLFLFAFSHSLCDHSFPSLPFTEQQYHACIISTPKQSFSNSKNSIQIKEKELYFFHHLSITSDLIN